ncbi:trihelix transcription factor ASIL1-like [Salvia hispanica]|uniref:trihelix transcription factor ASIL1-like n=1 Tax=Salvia hispanica TaxID=49212 RepID=UPI00200963F5|nr:trihelix transcription factor ASIL1-like [Salvia hispanica]
MEKDDNKHQQLENPPPSLLSPNQNPNTNVAADRLKRDEWSEGAVSCLLEAYEAKWTLRNRAKLKGQDWEEIAKHVSARAAASKSAKTQTQCKNKIESMKKRYRSESAAASSWPLYPRLDLLLRGNGVSAPNPPPVAVEEIGVNSPNSNGGGAVGKEEEGEGANNNEEKAIDESDSSTPAIDVEKEKGKVKRKRGREGCWESVRWLAEMVVRWEQSRMETMREIERIRAEAEAKRGELDLKRTEIIANTQLQIAKLFARGSSSIQ